jgi:hypothetical protein
VRAVAVACALVAAACFALATAAANRVGTPRADVLLGTPRADTIRALAGADFVDGLGGRDRVAAGPGADRVKAQDGVADAVSCGSGRDVVTGDRGDRVSGDCELVSRRISRDPFRGPPGQHETGVAPQAAAHGSVVVAGFQIGRISEGGAVAMGWASSRDEGRTWSSGIIGGLTRVREPRGRFERAAGPSVAYDSAHGVWLVAARAYTLRSEFGLAVVRSEDAVRWELPQIVVSSAGTAVAFEALACDNSAVSSFRGRCYLVYTVTRGAVGSLELRVTDDGGRTWSDPAEVRPSGTGAVPLVQPDGTLAIAYFDEDRIHALVSRDGASSFSPPALLGEARWNVAAGPLLAYPYPKGSVDADGSLYVVWHACAGAGRCRGDLFVTRSRDGAVWSPAARVALPGRAAGQKVIPALAASGSGRLALTFYRLSGRGLDVVFTSSQDGGATWRRPRLLNAERMALSWLPVSALPTVGNSLGTVVAGDAAVTVYSLAARPRPRRLLDESVFAARIPLP